MDKDGQIKLRIDVTKLKKEYFFKGEKGTYADLTLFYKAEQDEYGSNGMITQDVPKSIYEKEKDLPKEQRTKGPILGNAKVWKKERNTEGIPGGGATPAQASGSSSANDVADDLPF